MVKETTEVAERCYNPGRGRRLEFPSQPGGTMPEDGSGKKVFSYDEAAALLPEVRRLTDAAYRQVADLGAGTSGGVATAEVQTRIESVIGAWAQALMEMGIEVKGLWLVDFDNGSGYYCWRYPEDGLHFYHSYEDGFRGRMRIQ